MEEYLSNNKEISKTKEQPWLERLKSKWKAKSIIHVIIILCVFAIGGSLSGILAKKLLSLITISSTAVRIPFYILLVTLCWPICVITVSIPFGQFNFFKGYLIRIFNRMMGKK